MVTGANEFLNNLDLMIAVLVKILHLHVSLEFVHDYCHLGVGAKVGLLGDVPVLGNVRDGVSCLLVRYLLGGLSFDDVILRVDHDFLALGRDLDLLVLHGDLGRHDGLLKLGNGSSFVHHVTMVNGTTVATGVFFGGHFNRLLI